MFYQNPVIVCHNGKVRQRIKVTIQLWTSADKNLWNRMKSCQVSKQYRTIEKYPDCCQISTLAKLWHVLSKSSITVCHKWKSLSNNQGMSIEKFDVKCKSSIDFDRFDNHFDRLRLIRPITSIDFDWLRSIRQSNFSIDIPWHRWFHDLN